MRRYSGVLWDVDGRREKALERPFEDRAREAIRSVTESRGVPVIRILTREEGVPVVVDGIPVQGGQRNAVSVEGQMLLCLNEVGGRSEAS